MRERAQKECVGIDAPRVQAYWPSRSLRPLFLSANSFSAPIDDLRASSTRLQVLEISNTDSLADSFSNPQTATVYLTV